MDDEHPVPTATVEGLLADPATSLALRRVLFDWAGRDPVDAANEAACLAEALDRRVREGLECIH